MIAVVSLSDAVPPVPTGWIIAFDTDDARRQAMAAGRMDLAQILYTMPPPFMWQEAKIEVLPNTWLLRTP